MNQQQDESLAGSQEFSALQKVSEATEVASSVSDSKIFRDFTYLQPLSSPPSGKPIGRKSKLSLILDVVNGKWRRNLFVFGKPGTGKTLCVRYALEEARKGGINCVYVNAGKTRTPYYTMVEIARGLGISVPYSGWQMARLKQEFEWAVGSKDIVVALDEVDILLEREKEPIPYYMSRQPNVRLIMVANKYGNLAQLPLRVISTLQPVPVLFDAYSVEEAKAIIKDRILVALHPNVVGEEIIEKLASAANLTHDVRIAYNIIMIAGRMAEMKGKDKIEGSELHAALRLLVASL